MNSHLNIFNTYTNKYRSHHLENDLTRALAITLQEDILFLHEVLKVIFQSGNHFNKLFDTDENQLDIKIDIQKKTTQLEDFDHIYAVALSEHPLTDFWSKNHNRDYDPICDLVIKLDNILIVIEAKRDNFDCTAQLYNQIRNICKPQNGEKFDFTREVFENKITPFDLNWPKLMDIAVRVLNFEKHFSNPNRFLIDFVSLIQIHNYRWLPEVPISSLKPDKIASINKRLVSSILSASSRGSVIKLDYNDRLGVEINQNWAKEILFNIKNGDLVISVYPGNTKSQGYALFGKNHIISNSVKILDKDYQVYKNYHIKFTSFQKYFSGLWFSEDKLKEVFYTTENFQMYTGRKKRGEDWNQLEKLFDRCLNFDWRKSCNWDNLVIKSGKNQMDVSFGYELSIKIPFELLKQLDKDKNDLRFMADLILEIHNVIENNLIHFDSI